MKIFTVIFSAYVLFLVGIPCVDNPWNGNLRMSGCSHHTAEGNQDRADHCSPLCVCDCCATAVIHPENTVYFYGMSVQRPFCFFFLSDHLSAPSFAIWQPPKIA